MKRKVNRIIALMLIFVVILTLGIANDQISAKADDSVIVIITGGDDLLEKIGPSGPVPYIWIDENDASSGTVSLSSSAHTFKFQETFGKTIEKVKINGTEYDVSDAGEGKKYVSGVPHAASYSVELIEGVSDDVTIVWCYNREDVPLFGGDDALVEHGKIDILSITRGGASVWTKGGSDNDDVHIDSAGGYVRVHPHDKIEVQFIPDYGYQLIGAKINGEVDLDVQESACTYLFEMPETNVHFQGIFQKTEDKITGSATNISGASLTNGNAVASIGTAQMDIATGTADTDTVSETEDDSKSRIAVNINVKQVLYKNSESSAWETPKTELGSNAEVVLNVSQPAKGYAVLRNHNGTITEIPSDYDSASGTIAFASNQFSTYTLVPLNEAKNDYERLNPINNVTPNSDNKGNRHVHSYSWKVSVAPTINEEGLAINVCSCGHINGTQKISNESVVYTAFSHKLYELIKNTNAGDTIILDLGYWNSVPDWLMTQIRESNRTVILKYVYMKNNYSLTIPNGKCVDAHVPWYGPLFMWAIYK